ncbi:Secreted protein [Plasmodiophora brassicae]
MKVASLIVVACLALGHGLDVFSPSDTTIQQYRAGEPMTVSYRLYNALNAGTKAVQVSITGSSSAPARYRTLQGVTLDTQDNFSQVVYNSTIKLPGDLTPGPYVVWFLEKRSAGVAYYSYYAYNSQITIVPGGSTTPPSKCYNAPRPDYRCGASYGYAACTNANDCCSSLGWCGSSDAFCGADAQCRPT